MQVFSLNYPATDTAEERNTGTNCKVKIAPLWLESPERFKCTLTDACHFRTPSLCSRWLQERRLFPPTPHHAFFHNPLPSGGEFPCWYDTGHSSVVGVSEGFPKLVRSRSRITSRALCRNIRFVALICPVGILIPYSCFIQRRRFEEVVLKVVMLLSASYGRRFLGGGSWDRGQIRGRAQGFVIRGCDPLSSFCSAVP